MENSSGRGPGDETEQKAADPLRRFLAERAAAGFVSGDPLLRSACGYRGSLREGKAGSKKYALVNGEALTGASFNPVS